MSRRLLDAQLSPYLDGLVPPRPPEMAAMEAEAAKTDFPIIGPTAGHVCYLIARLIGARSVFELGSGFGYSTAWFARAVRDNGGGVVHHTVWDDELSRRARGHLSALGYADLVTFHVGESVAALRESKGPFDLIFNDIDKAGYPASLPVIASRLRPGGVLIVDNMLWSGRIFDEADRSAHTQGVRTLTQLVTADPDWTASIIPVRDGLLVAQRNPRGRAGAPVRPERT
ncbi:MAG TPA: O-methyltransferase [Vicinamibacterales bacterium]|nr:O-methyltransferase [Vicinamibacterales bacterium]